MIASTTAKTPRIASRLLVASLLLSLAETSRAGDVRTEAANLRFSVPAEWTRVPAPSDVRAGQWRIPRAGGDTGDGELVLFFFGKGQGGSTDANLERWYGQFTQPDGRPTKDAAVVTIRTVRGLKVTSVDVAGTYSGAAMTPGAPTKAKPGTRLLGAIVEGEDGPWFFKATGPDATIAHAKPAFEGLVGSLEAHR